MRRKHYVGLTVGGERFEYFSFEGTPTPKSTPMYGAVIGPFKTYRGAVFTARYGRSNPHIRVASDGDRIAREIQYDPKSNTFGN